MFGVWNLLTTALVTSNLHERCQLLSKQQWNWEAWRRLEMETHSECVAALIKKIHCQMVQQTKYFLPGILWLTFLQADGFSCSAGGGNTSLEYFLDVVFMHWIGFPSTLTQTQSLFCAVKSSAGVLRDFSGAAALCRTASLVKFVNERTRLGERSQNK